MTAFVEFLLALIVGFILIVFGIALWFGHRFRQDVENALKNADESEQAEIRKKVVKAMFPPRFDRN